MGFWDTAGKIAQGAGTVAKGAMNKIEAFNAETAQLVEKYQNEDEDYLRRKIKSGSTAEKAAAAKILKGRGLGPS